MIEPIEVAALQAAFRANPNDLGVGLYNHTTGEIHIASFDLVAQRQGHQGLADALGITATTNWRGFSLSSGGVFAPVSHFNLPDGGLMMLPQMARKVEQALRTAGLIA